jgi:hypothetical protein
MAAMEEVEGAIRFISVGDDRAILVHDYASDAVDYM